MELWLLRHARARAAGSGENDQDRPLTESGRETIRRLGALIRQSGRKLPQRILVSPAVRTRQTATALLEELDGPEPVLERRLWEALEEDLIRIIQDYADDSSALMLIGHNPGLEWLVQWQTNQRPRLGMQPGTLVIIGDSSPLTPATGHIETLIQPSDLV